MAEEHSSKAESKCQGATYGARPCMRPIWPKDGQYCICHSKLPNKDERAIQREVDKVIQNKHCEEYDFTGWVFESIDLKNHGPIRKPIYFCGATFRKSARFAHVRFEAHASFQNGKFEDGCLAWFGASTFRKVADFQYCQFADRVEFDRVEFQAKAAFLFARFDKRASFDKTVFRDEAVFLMAEARGRLEFSGSQLMGHANFAFMKCKAPARFQGVDFAGPAIFNHISSDQELEYIDSAFRDSAIFVECDFRGKATFENTIFFHGADFSAVRIRGTTEFLGVTFHSLVSFYHGHVFPSARLVLDGEAQSSESLRVFGDKADFRRIQIDDPGRLSFRKINLSSAQFLESDIEAMRFSAVAWRRIPLATTGVLTRTGAVGRIVSRMVPVERSCVADEHAESLDKQYLELLAELYRGLQANYTRKYGYVQAGDFYIGEQEVMRSAKGKWRSHFCVGNLFRIVSYYGESYFLPLFWLSVVLISAPVYLFLVASPYGRHSLAWSWNPSDALFLKTEYWNAFGTNLALITFARGDMCTVMRQPYEYIFIILESVIVISLITFFLLALRRKFKRKAF